MTEFFKKSQTVNVSRISNEGWWLENTKEHVVKGTALGFDFTQDIYSPSTDGMIARYDRDLKQWSDEIEDMTWKPYFNNYGDLFYIGEPDGDYPEWAIKETPPEHDKETQTVLYMNKNWKVFDIEIGKPYWDSECNKFIISDYNFTLPENHSFIEPPKAKEGFAVRLVNNQWEQLEDHREQMAFAKDRDNDEKGDYQVEEFGAIPDTHTLLEPEQFDSWNVEIDAWKYDIERERPYKEVDERQWRGDKLDKILSRIDQYERERNYPEDLKTSPIQNESDLLILLKDRKLLSDYPQDPTFPFCERPKINSDELFALFNHKNNVKV